MRFAHMDDAAQPLVLVVEDNELLRLHAADLLEAPRFAVIKAEGFVRVTAGLYAWRSTPRPKRPLGREGAPLGQRAGSSLFVNLASDEMALLIEMVVDLSMN